MERHRVTRRALNLTDRESVGEEAHKSIINNKLRKKEYYEQKSTLLYVVIGGGECLGPIQN